ncbi:MAG: hypothetical protein IPQ14_01965 [Candidatus Microthrix sp.]|uniref:hypothetical protein n=1 Tax=Candidatus Neomicrothrix sp. TaxID=2719034 RepID=UPI0025C37AC6|nr:hypothetical protein [Candidatus Microthrix sp.]MBL0203111.1 hypothetical protein [Candidatus Microthrix sp.]
MVLSRPDETANELMELLSNGLNRLPTSMTSSLFGAMLKETTSPHRTFRVPPSPSISWANAC